MSRSETSSAELDDLPETWRRVLADLEFEPREELASHGGRFQLAEAFADRGFLRLLLDRGAPPRSISVQSALPVDEAHRSSHVEAIQREFEDLTDLEWEAQQDDLQSTLEAVTDDELAESQLAPWLRRISELVEFVTSERGEGEPDWLTRRRQGEETEPRADASRRTGRDSRRHTRETSGSDRHTSEPTASSSRRESGARARSSSDDVFESIGEGRSEDVLRGGDESPSARASEARLESFELQLDGDFVELAVRLQRDHADDVIEHVGRALAHALRARFDASARPLSPSDVEARGTHDPSRDVCVRVEPSDWSREQGRRPEGLDEDVEHYLERLQRFDDLGVSIGEALGIEDDGVAADASTEEDSAGLSSGRRSRGQMDAGDSSPRNAGSPPRRSSERSSSSRTSEEHLSRDPRSESGESSSGRDRRERSRQDGRDEDQRRRDATDSPSRSDETSSDEDEIVLGGADSSPDPEPAEPETGLTPGDYTDPRLMRDDATTSLVDVVLRHPGYAEDKMGHNLSILLGVDFPEAMELVETAPRVIAWGVGRERASRFQRVIEEAGGKVVLVEPDSLQDAQR